MEGGVETRKGERCVNVISLLTPKAQVTFVYEDCSIRQGLQKLRVHSYTAIPVLARDGSYVGTISEGDFLWYMLDQGGGDVQSAERVPLRRVLRKTFNPAVSIQVSMDELLERAMHQSFIPVVDDRGAFIGIVTRKTILRRLTVPCVQQISRAQTELRLPEQPQPEPVATA